MNDEKIIFLDMDGVLFDFISSAMQIHGSKFDEKHWPKGEWYVEKVLGITTEEFWRGIEFGGAAFWENLSPYSYTAEFVDRLRLLETEIKICTSPSRSGECLVGKKRCLQKHGLGDLEVIYTNSKHLLAAPNRILIDDSATNLAGFLQFGGAIAPFPQVWNKFDLKPEDAAPWAVFEQVEKWVDS